MEIVLIDTHIVPEQSKSEFRQAAVNAHRFVSSLPGYVEGYTYEQMDGESKINFLTMAVWKDEQAYKDAKKTVLAEYERTGYDPAVTRQRLGIEQTRSIYTRTR